MPQEFPPHGENEERPRKIVKKTIFRGPLIEIGHSILSLAQEHLMDPLFRASLFAGMREGKALGYMCDCVWG